MVAILPRGGEGVVYIDGGSHTARCPLTGVDLWLKDTYVILIALAKYLSSLVKKQLSLIPPGIHLTDCLIRLWGCVPGGFSIAYQFPSTHAEA